MSKFNIGDKVLLINLKGLPRDTWPGIMSDMLSFSNKYKDKNITIYTVEILYGNKPCYRFKEDHNKFLYHENWLRIEVEIPKEEQLLNKIDYLWKKQEYYKTHLTTN